VEASPIRRSLHDKRGDGQTATARARARITVNLSHMSNGDQHSFVIFLKMSYIIAAQRRILAFPISSV
jgi:hypothetical protein